MPLEEIIRRCRPAERDTGDCAFGAHYAVWLARWLVYSTPDRAVREKAVEFAMRAMTHGQPRTK